MATSSNINIGNLKLQSQEIPYAYFPYTCSMVELLNIMNKEWNLDLPKIMLLIVSDNNYLKGWDSHKEQEKFMEGLIKSSNATSMWIFTSGLNIGVSKVIGDAFEEDYKKRLSQICIRHAKEKTVISKLPLMGVCSETMLTYHHQFEIPASVMELKNIGNKLEDQKFDLNPHHTNFLIIKDKSFIEDCTSRFLLRLADTLRHAKFSESEDESTFPKSPVPIIAILIQGDLSSVHYILQHLRRRLPVLVIKGSGGLADVFAYAYSETNRSSQKIKDKDFIETIFKRGLHDKITSLFPDLKDNKMAKNLLCERILKCIEVSEPPEMKYITVLDVSDLTIHMEKLPYYLLQVYFKSRQKEDLSEQDRLAKDLQLTLDWNCPEIALTKVFYKDPNFKIDNDIFEQAFLQEGREEFVSLFLDNKFEVHKYLNADRLIKLFEHSLKDSFFLEVCWEGILGYRYVGKLGRSFIDFDLNWIIEYLTGRIKGKSIIFNAEKLNEASEEKFNELRSLEVNISIARQRALLLLIIWALVSRRSELAMVLWHHTDQPVMTALFASLILHEMIPLIGESRTKEEIADLSKKFASMAVGVFDLCYNDLPTKAYEALQNRMAEWRNLSLIDMASLSKNRTFVAHSCCQKWLTNKFMGSVKFREISWGYVTVPSYMKVILCAFFSFPMYWWVRFKETNEEEIESTEFEKEDQFLFEEEEHWFASGHRITWREESAHANLLKYQYPPLWQMIYYMWSAPITKFWVSNIFYVIYLALFSVAVMWPSCGSAVLDSIVCLWTLLIAIDSIYLLYSINKTYPNTPLFRNSLEIIYMLFFVLFYYLLRILNAEGFRDPYSGKILICLGLIYFYYRMIFIYLPISSTLGPLLYRVKTMLTDDFVNFMKLVMFIIIGNAIAMQAILYPDYPLIPELIRLSFHKAISAFFVTPAGELTENNPTCVKWEQKPSTRTMCRVSDYMDGQCSDGIKIWPYVIVLQYILLMKLVFMTILFALFNATGARISAETDSIWKFQRYKLIINFSNTLRLPPPLNIFSVLITVCKFLINCCKRGASIMKKKEEEMQADSRNEKYFSPETHLYWRQLATDYYNSKIKEKEEEDFVKKELDILSQLYDDLQVKEGLIYQSKAQIKQLESDIIHTHAHLETLKYRVKEKDSKEIFLHSLSRESPYPETNIQRFLVPDKYVPWEVTWLHYDPIFYTMPKKKFPKIRQPYTDEDVMKTKGGVMKRDSTVFMWNMEYKDSSGIYKDRKSWITDSSGQPVIYIVDKYNLPRNPKGRTGLRGKGALPRWGPNHHVFVIITRWKVVEHREDLMETPNYLEFVETWFMKKKDISLPGGFVWTDNRYEVVQTHFQMDDDGKPWLASEDMIAFFKNLIVSSSDEESSEDKVTEDNFSSKLVYSGYMDDQRNTDHAWKEVELWHIHYNVPTNLKNKFKANIHWRVLSEGVFIQLPYGQTILLQDAIKHLNAKIAPLYL